LTSWNRLTQFDELPETALLSIREISALSSRSRASLWRDVQNGHLPRPIKIGNRASRWKAKDVRRFIAGREAVEAV
tara:strand:- start:293 stop:520 length:228 start_codon:yes stop_codon:yes gene_type:complete